MGLTPHDLKMLQAPFRLTEHEFIGNYAYIQEEPLTTRLDIVDPGWEFDVVEVAARDEQIFTVARLTIKGVTRANVGMQAISYAKERDKSYRIDEFTKERIEIGEPEKGGTTDALKRCARLFGVGRYLLNAPSKGAAFDKWLTDLQQKAGIAGAELYVLETGERLQPTGTEGAQPTPAPQMSVVDKPATPKGKPTMNTYQCGSLTFEKNNSRVFHCNDGTNVVVWGISEHFLQHGVVDAQWEAWHKAGTITFNPPLEIEAVQVKGKWELKAVSDHPSFHKAASKPQSGNTQSDETQVVDDADIPF